MSEFLRGCLILAAYFVLCASSALVLHRLVRIADEVFRKLLHFILLGSMAVLSYAFFPWWAATLAALGFAAVVYPILALAERIPGYSALLTERSGGEIKRSLLVVFSMYAIVNSICWGWLGDRLLTLVCIYAWGVGDATAALIGKRFGRHPLKWKHLDGRKSAEGTAAMFAVSFVCVLALLLVHGGLPWYGHVLTAAAAASALTELYTPNGMDTITCPLAAMTVILPLVHIFGGAL